jgi:pimeloyl-ACP methyl ester carboxylesterase
VAFPRASQLYDWHWGSKRKAVKTHVLRLSDGRDLAVLQLGPDTGRPLFFLHGFAASRLTIPPGEEVFHELGIRLLSVDRPGTGLSSPSASPSVLGFGRDIGEAATLLGHDRFAVCGWSAGGAYALGTAAALPDRVRRVTLVSGAAASHGPDAYKGRRRFIKFGELLSRRVPPLIRLAAIGVARSVRRRPSRGIARMERFVGPADRRVLAKRANRDAFTDGAAEAFRQIWRGTYFDALAISKDWGFRMADIHVPVALWHGLEDNTVWPATARHNAARLGTRDVTMVADAGHFLIFQRWKDIVAAAAAP